MLTIENMDKIIGYRIGCSDGNRWVIDDIRDYPDHYKIYVRQNVTMNIERFDLMRQKYDKSRYKVIHGSTISTIEEDAVGSIYILMTLIANRLTPTGRTHTILPPVITPLNQMWPIKNWTSLRPPGISTTIGTFTCTFACLTPIRLTR